MGAQDIYFTSSINGGKSFSYPQKAGKGTWLLEACPMDGGGVFIDKNGNITTSWRKNNDIFISKGTQPEIKVGTGRNVSMSNAYVAWQQDETIYAYRSGKLIKIG